MEDSYKTIQDEFSTEIKIKRSRFIGTARHCNSREAAEQLLESFSKKYYDANHNCFAYRVRAASGEEIFRYSDAGEPSGTAGRPIYDSLVSSGLQNILLVVTRYFGGIKLGTGGLARAYRDSARAVLDLCRPVEVLIVERFRLIFPLNLTNIVLRILNADGIKIIENNYTDKGEIIFEVRLSKSEAVRENLISSTNARVELSKL